jgi:cytoskeleton protein RodZ
MTLSHIEATAASSSGRSGNPGDTLRQAREERGWQVAEVAAKLNLTAQSLAQLEAGEFDRLPGHTFARGYVRAYAKLLGLDQAELVEAFDRYTGTNASGSTVHSLGYVPEPLRLSRTVLRLVSAVLLLLLLLLGYFWWQERPERLASLGVFGLKHIEVESADGTTELHPLDELEDQAVVAGLQGGEAPLAEESAPAPAVGLPLDAGEEPAQPASEAAAEPQAAPSEAAPVAAQPVQEAGVTPPAPAVAEAPSAAAPAAAPAAESAVVPVPQVAAGEGLISASFSADCWVQVTDGNGRVLLSTVKQAGDSLQVSGKAPLELRLGNARGARDVLFNGAPVEHLKNMTASGTARINLGQ